MRSKQSESTSDKDRGTVDAPPPGILPLHLGSEWGERKISYASESGAYFRHSTLSAMEITYRNTDTTSFTTVYSLVFIC